MPHLPVLSHALDSKCERITSENAIQGVNDRHQMSLPVMLDERDLSKEIRLHDGQRRDFAQRDSSLFIPVLRAIDGVESGERLSDRFGSKWPVVSFCPNRYYVPDN